MSSTTSSADARARLKTMLCLQDDINSKINAAWIHSGNPWYRAIWTECAEMMDHVGWKWWKKNQPDLEQIHLELVDIFHFGLSELIVANGSVEAAQNAAQAAYQSIEDSAQKGTIDAAKLLKLIEEFASATLTTKSFVKNSFANLCALVGLAGDSLYRKYVGKNVLNTFRQNHGYKDGTYVKVWSGREDNEWLVDIGANLQAASDSFPSELYQALEHTYQTHSGAEHK